MKFHGTDVSIMVMPLEGVTNYAVSFQIHLKLSRDIFIDSTTNLKLS